MRRCKLPRAAVEHPVRLALLALGLSLGLAFVSCQDERSITDARHAPRIAASVQTSTAVISPTADGFLNINATNYASSATLNVYTWPDNKIANAIVLKFDLSSIPPGATISSAALNLNLTGSDATGDPTYTVTVHKIVNKNPDLTRATGYTYDGANAWTQNTCCYNNIPLAQADIGAPVATKAVDKTPGFKQWDVTSLVQGWLSAPSTNFGLLVNSDPSKLRDRYRTFSSSEDPVASNRPYLTVVYAAPAPAPPPGEHSAVLSPVFPAPIVQLHLHLLPNGKVLSWGYTGNPQLWDPATGTFAAVPSPSLLFCSGHNFLADGRLLVAGGQIPNEGSHGLPNTNLFDALTGTWQIATVMTKGRWYPTNTTLPDGQVLTVAGTDQNGAVVTIPEIWNGSSWRQLTTASLGLEYYPRNFVAPDGRVFYAGEEQPSRWLDVTGTGK